jgi:hypothetical protein
MQQEVKKYDELAPCGVYCGACPSFKKSCLGCAPEDKNQTRGSKWGCKIRNCCYNQQILGYCADCDRFPCLIFTKKLLSVHQDDPRFTYRFELPWLVARYKAAGLDDYISFQKPRWKCEACGGTVRFYHYTCDTCGKEKMIK